jgi:hypothetical protein
MSGAVVVLKTFDNEIDAGMAQQVLHGAGVSAFVFKDDAGGMEPHLQLTTGVRLVVSRADTEHSPANTPDFDIKLNSTQRFS